MITEVKVEEVSLINTYEVTVIHMHGDADNYTTDVNFFDLEGKLKNGYTDEEDYGEAMIELINFLLACKAKYPNGMGGDDGYWDVEGYEKYEDFLFSDNDCCEGHATPESITVFFYDEIGVKHVCSLV